MAAFVKADRRLQRMVILSLAPAADGLAASAPSWRNFKTDSRGSPMSNTGGRGRWSKQETSFLKKRSKKLSSLAAGMKFTPANSLLS
jgi:hypothetical protein